MTTITINQELNWEKTDFKNVDELKAYLIGVLSENNDLLDKELEYRLGEMDESPKDNITAQEAIFFAKYGKDKI